jgi:hypothetical protein
MLLVEEEELKDQMELFRAGCDRWKALALVGGGEE